MTQQPEYYQVFGKKATKNEYNVAEALNYYEIPFIFRVSYFGGHSIVGGFEVDFLILQQLKRPLEVYGNYWHKGQLGSRDRFREIVLEQFFHQPLDIIWQRESETIDAAKISVRKLYL